MTEAEWLSAADPSAIALHLHLHARETGSVLRRSRLTAVACCRRIPANVMPVEGATLLDAVEAWVDTGGRRPRLVGLMEHGFDIDTELLTPGWRAARTGQLADRRWHAANALAVVGMLSRSPQDQHLILRCASEAAHAHPRPRPAKAEAAALLRCVFGNPFRPAAFDPTWRNTTAVAVAEGIYTDRAFDRLPVLADALEDAGCDSEQLLAHLRSPGPHARGCWAVDAVLGKI